jgi:CRISPR system Cascade subunit CasA
MAPVFHTASLVMTMNLATEPWIPVLYANGARQLVSLERAFADGAKIRDLTVRPHERIALMRLLLCVAHAGLSGLKDHKDWLRCRPRIAKAARRHLGAHRDKFKLLGDGPRFGQLYSGTKYEPEIDTKEPTLASKLELTLATGHNPTLFDNAGARRRRFPPSDLARMLVCFLCFAPQQLGQGYKGKSPCSRDSMLHTLLRGANLLETIWLNLLDAETIRLTYGRTLGKPVWLAMPRSAKDRAAVRNATQTYMGRLLPLAHAILLGEDGEILKIVQDCGFVFPGWTAEPPEPTATTVTVSKRRREVLSAQLHRSVWRDLPSLTTKRRSEGPRGALAWQRFPEDRECDFWVGALITDGKAKVLNTVESSFQLPKGASTDEYLNFYSGGVCYAEDWARALERGLVTYRRTLGDDLGRREARKRARLLKQKAASHFWTAIEAAAGDVLVPLCGNPPDKLKCAAPYYLDYSRDESRWGPLVRRAAGDAFALACPRASARQAAAFGEGRMEMLRRQPVPKRETNRTWRHR